MTPDAARAAIAARRWDRGFMDRYYGGDPAAKAEMDGLYDTMTTGAPDPNAPLPPLPPASRGELDASLSNSIRYPAGTTDDDRMAFHIAARDGLGALGVTAGEAGAFTLAASEVLKAPADFTPESAERALRATWGGSYDQNIGLARAAVQRLPLHVRAQLTETPLGNSPRIMQLLADAGRRMARR